MNHHIHDRQSTEAQFFAEYDKLKSDLAEANQQIMVLTDQLRTERTTNEGLAYKVDFLVAQVERVTASGAQYERVVVRVSAIADTIASVAAKQLADLREEIKLAAFINVPGTVQSAPEGMEEGEKPLFLQGDDYVTHQIVGHGSSSDLLPISRLGNGAVRT